MNEMSGECRVWWCLRARTYVARGGGRTDHQDAARGDGGAIHVLHVPTSYVGTRYMYYVLHVPISVVHV